MQPLVERIREWLALPSTAPRLEHRAMLERLFDELDLELVIACIMEHAEPALCECTDGMDSSYGTYELLTHGVRVSGHVWLDCSWRVPFEVDLVLDAHRQRLRLTILRIHDSETSKRSQRSIPPHHSPWPHVFVCHPDVFAAKPRALEWQTMARTLTELPSRKLSTYASLWYDPWFDIHVSSPLVLDFEGLQLEVWGHYIDRLALSSHHVRLDHHPHQLPFRCDESRWAWRIPGSVERLVGQKLEDVHLAFRHGTLVGVLFEFRDAVLSCFNTGDELTLDVSHHVPKLPSYEWYSARDMGEGVDVTRFAPHYTWLLREDAES